MKMKNNLSAEKEDFLSACLEWALEQKPTDPLLEWIEWAMRRLGIPQSEIRKGVAE
jgi:hypothetical protein